MKNLYEDLEDYLRNGKGTRTKLQATILDLWSEVLYSGIPANDSMCIAQNLEKVHEIINRETSKND